MIAALVAFKRLARVFKKQGFSLYLVGGAVRDYLIKRPLDDLDLAGEATPEEVLSFLKADETFKKYGFLKINFKGFKFDYVTFRKEDKYQDYRHPENVFFTKDINEDILRRDLSINALYMDSRFRIIDLVNGENDLMNHLIRLLGNPEERIKEDPLRILRILRVKVDLGFNIEENTFKAIKENCQLINKLKPQKIKEELNKCSNPTLMEKELNLIFKR